MPVCFLVCRARAELSLTCYAIVYMLRILGLIVLHCVNGYRHLPSMSFYCFEVIPPCSEFAFAISCSQVDSGCYLIDAP
jgi:hypothetical protein